ncbi:sugar transferase [Fuerstiella marisgermanici]|uniref:UDP-glucose:undecaprenyl-phosphate glucose-1-phosphate transferase n=1 Tax=Fuerstiella marisgermanici TaxID=1891926 RepID=A0A1P8WLX1_9PLAN|nr:sugar transferase [Fuerstiella marisgermanici]APZ95072.1 UDP-glucose:undecaprenyl-phosphate glucose-1-phosphate transferase [Fuerstiella marisgermanici]
MAKRLFDIVAAATALIVLGPIILLAAVGVRLSSKGPAFYCPHRIGRGGKRFTLFKLRTMHVDHGGNASVVTGATDARVFAFGNMLRKLKLDELPQLWNILKGDMSVVGPRPEDPKIVELHYDELGWETLAVRPGLAGVSSIYNYTHGERMLTGPNPEQIYVRELLPIKLALEVVYLRNASLVYDAKLILRTVAAIGQIVSGRTEFADPPEMPEARTLLAASSVALQRAA